MRKIGGRIDQHLARDRRAVAVARCDRDHRGEIAAGAVAADHQPRGVDAELFGVVGDPFRRRDGVVDGGGKFVLGREPVIDRDHDQLAFVGQLAAHHVVGIEIADHPAAAVKEHQARREAVGLPQLCRRVDARGDRPGGRGDRERLDRFEFRRLGIADEAGLQIELARLGRRQRLVRRPAGFLERLEHGGGIGIEGHGHDGSLMIGGHSGTARPGTRIPSNCTSAVGPSRNNNFKPRFVRRRRCRPSPRHSSPRRRRGTRRWRRLPTPGRAGAPESARRSSRWGPARCRDCGRR